MNDYSNCEMVFALTVILTSKYATDETQDASLKEGKCYPMFQHWSFKSAGKKTYQTKLV